MPQNDFNLKIIDEFRANAGVVGAPFKGMPMILVTMTGAKSGNTMTTPLVYSKDGDRYVIIASMGGAPKHPNWYHNLKAHPEITLEIGTEKFQARATEVSGAERDRLYTQQAGQMPAFKEYAEKTDRTIPVFVLERA
jgi:deazaflavin-dependent oxidoreductase (nitroreductase family)